MKGSRINLAVKVSILLCVLVILCCTVTADTTYNKKWAVLIGIEDYKTLQPDLAYCVDDVNDMYSLLVDNCRFPSSNIYKYTNTQAKKSNIKNGINNLARKTSNSDLVIFYFTGHGKYNYWGDSAPYDEADGSDESLRLYDSKPSSNSNDITDDDLKTWLDSVPSKNTVIIIDACGSGGMTKEADRTNTSVSSGIIEESPDSGVDGFRDIVRDVSGRKYLVLMAADEDEDSSELGGNIQNGVFTYYLMQGITKSSINTDNDAWISFEEAFVYAKPLSTNAYSGQHPQIYDTDSSEVGIYPLGSTPTPTTTQVSAEGTSREKQSWDRSVRAGRQRIPSCFQAGYQVVQ